MALTLKTGSLFDSTADAYAHGVNTEGLMGAGIAVLFKKAYPDMYASYKQLCKDGILEAGEIFAWDRLGAVPIRTPVPNPRWIYNIASQDKPGANARLEWFETGLTRMLKHAKANGVKSIAMPRIGCGIGGLEWEDVLDILEHYSSKVDVEIEVWTP